MFLQNNAFVHCLLNLFYKLQKTNKMKNFSIKDLLITIAPSDNRFEINNDCGGPSSPTGPCSGPSSPTGPCSGPSSPTGPCSGPSSPTGPCSGPSKPTGPACSGPSSPTGPAPCKAPSSPTGPASRELFDVTATAALINLKKTLEEMQAKKQSEKAA